MLLRDKRESEGAANPNQMWERHLNWNVIKVEQSFKLKIKLISSEMDLRPGMAGWDYISYTHTSYHQALAVELIYFREWKSF